MREMNEYTAEVIRRASDKKQHRRADLTRALGVSCAVVVCAVALLGVLGKLRATHDGVDSLPTHEVDGVIAGDGQLPSFHAGGEGTDGINDGTAGAGFVSVEIALPGSAVIALSSPEAAAAVAEAIAEAKAASSLVKHAGEGISAATEHDAHIRLIAADGSAAEYLVIGNMLYRVGAGDAWLMPDEALAELMIRLDAQQ